MDYIQYNIIYIYYDDDDDYYYSYYHYCYYYNYEYIFGYIYIQITKDTQITSQTDSKKANRMWSLMPNEP